MKEAQLPAVLDGDRVVEVPHEVRRDEPVGRMQPGQRRGEFYLIDLINRNQQRDEDDTAQDMIPGHQQRDR